jgi:hypothetical protein
VDVVGLLSDGDRLRVFAAVVLGATSLEQVRDATGLDARAAGTAVNKLVDGGLLAEDKGGYHVQEHELRLAARHGREPAPVEDDVGAIRRAFFKGERLDRIPAARAKRLAVLDVFAQDFEPGVRYTEKQVNLVIGKRFADTATIRRYLVDEGFLDREGGGGRYWRVGGTVDL